MLDLHETRWSVWFAICCVTLICMTDMKSLIFLILFHYWAAFMVYRQNRINNTTSNSLTNIFSVNHIEDGSFQAAHGSGCKSAHLHKICHTYPTMIKLSMVIPYLTKVQHIYKSRGTHIKFCWHQYFFTKNQQLLLYQDIQIEIAFQYIIGDSFK